MRKLDPKTDNIDARGRFLEQIEEDEGKTQNNSPNEEQWQLARGKSASNKNVDGRNEIGVNIGNAFKALVDTAQKIAQMTENQDQGRELPRDRGKGGNMNPRSIKQ